MEFAGHSMASHPSSGSHVPVASYIPLHSDSFLCNRSPGPGLSDSSSIGYATRHNSIVAVICP